MDTANIRVLEIGDDVAVAYCGLQFARWGADVVVSAQHTGGLRDLPPLAAGVSVPFEFLTVNKRLADEGIEELAHDADLILTSLDDDALAAAGAVPGDATIVHRILPWASGGTYFGTPGPDLLIEAAAGYLEINGEPDREPARAPANLISHVAGAAAFMASLAALHQRVRGVVEHIETSKLDALTSMTPFIRSQYTGDADTRHGGPGTGVRLWQIGEGHISANLFGKRTFAEALEHLGIDPDSVPEHLDTPQKRYDTAAVHAFLHANAGAKNAEDLFNAMLAADLPAIGLLQTPAQMLTNDHLVAIDHFDSMTHPELGNVRYPGNPARTAAPVPPMPKAGMSVDRPSWQRERLPVSKGPIHNSDRPLEGVRIIDFTQAWIGPFATMMLADLGAEVIKIESHRRVDVWRNWPGNVPAENIANPDAHPFNTSGNFNSTNRNKREIAIDLTQPEGVEIARELIRDADVVMNNYTPRVMRKFGLDYASIIELNPHIISVAWSGYGEEGPYANYKANGTTIEAIAGWDALFGYRDGKPMVMGFYQADAITGLQMASAALLALLHRDLTGDGQRVSGSMLAAAIHYVGDEVMGASAGLESVRRGNRHPQMVPHGVFPCDGDNRYVAIACECDESARRLGNLVGLDMPRSIEQRREAEDRIEAAITAWTREQSRGDAVRQLRDAGVPAMEVLNVLDILGHPEFTRRGWFIPQVHPDMGETLHGGFPWRFSQSRLRADYPPPRLGEHSAEILRDVLGKDEEKIAALFASGTVGCVLAREEAEAAK